MELSDYKRQFREFLDATQENRELQLRDRDYLDHKQWTSREARILLERKQAPIVINRVRPKHAALVGMERQSRTDPKAFPRTPKHQGDADSITDALRFVADKNNFDQIASKVFGEVTCEGYAAAIVEMKKGEIAIRRIPWNRFYYDAHSSEPDFSDSTYFGISTWMHKADIERMFPDADLSQIGNIPEHMTDLTFEDRPLWIDRTNTKNPRFRVNEHYFLDDGVWKLVFFCGETLLTEPEPSPFLDEDGEPMCPIEAESAYVDSDNNRFGEVRGWIHIQDEINHRRSKALHMLSRVTVIGKAGSVDSTSKVLNQLASGNAFIEVKDFEGFEIRDNTEFAQGQLALLQDAKNEIDAVGVNAALTGKENSSSMSGRALQARQQAGVAELATLFDQHNDWKRRIYRQIWCRIKQFWTEERWIRVTDDERNVRFVGLNRRITGRDLVAQRLGVDPEQVDQVLEQQGIRMMPGQLDRVVGKENDVSKIDVDIIIAESPDVVTLKHERFEILARLAEIYGPDHVPFDELIRLTNFSDAEGYIERTKGSEEERQAMQQAAAQQQQAAAELQMQGAQARTAKDLAQARKANAEADRAAVESHQALMGQERIG